jgi:DNA ligase-1
LLLHELVETSRSVAETSGRREKIERLAALLRRVPAGEVAAAVWFLSGSPVQGRIGIGPAALRQARAQAAAGEPRLSIGDVDRELGALAATRGAGSGAEKLRRLCALLGQATAAEQDFLMRLLLGELRQGALEGIGFEAVARAAGVAPAEVRRAAMRAGSLASVAEAALRAGSAGLQRFRMQLFQPVQPMLAHPAEDVGEALERLGEAQLEWKLDGGRIQVHRAGDEVKLYSRGLRDVTPAVPEVVAAVRALPGGSWIADGEVIALRADGAPEPFQVTMRRFGRKLDVARHLRESPLTPFFFDLLYADGEDLSAEPQQRRFARLLELAPALAVPHLRAASEQQASRFLAEALARGHEGLMAKALDAPYEAGGRGRTWLKIKRAHSLDLVVLAAEWGHGRRRGWLSNLHLGARDAQRGGFVMLGKTFKGLTDAMLARQTQRLLELEAARDAHTVYVRPELVVEVAFSDVQESPQYPGGVALRFARVKRHRPDKPAREADLIETVQALCRRSG